MPQEPLNQNLDEVEAVLRSLEPAPCCLDHGALMYSAGRASAPTAAPLTRPGGSRRPGWLWPCATAVSLVAAATFATLWAGAGRREVVDRIVYVERDKPRATVVQPATGARPTNGPQQAWREYARLRDIALTQGLEHLPEVHWRSVANPPGHVGERFDISELVRSPGS